MGYAQVYATVKELVDDLRLTGETEAGLLNHIRAASQHVWREIGNFIPVTAARTFRSKSGEHELIVDPLISIASITEDGTALTANDEYRLTPRNGYWPNGPYLWVSRSDSDGDPDDWTDADVAITGSFGLWNETGTPNVSAVSQATSTETTLGVSNGAEVSPGMVLLIESEQELVTGYSSWTDSGLNTGEALDAVDEEITLSSSADVLNVGETLKIDFEQMKILDVATSSIWVARGWNGTKKASHANPSDVYVMRTFTVERGVNGTTAAIHSSKTLYRYKVPQDVNWIVRQVAGLMRMKAAAGFASKSGNPELGETFYFNEYPRQIEQIKANYWLPH